ncbi:hypothetical protein JCM10212_003838 [Sporobolomyces blumeae]
MSTPTRAESDPLKSRRDLDAVPSLSPASSPISFKRRTPSSRPSVATKASNLIGNILSTHDQNRDVVPTPSGSTSLSRSNAPTRVDLAHDNHRDRLVSDSQYSQAIASDDDDDQQDDAIDPQDDEGDDVHRRGDRGARLSFAAGTAPPRLVPPYTRVMHSPTKDRGDLRSPRGGGRDEDVDPIPFTATPLPKIPMIVLCVALFGEFLSASISSPFLFFMVESFGVGENGGGESAVSLWSGVVAAAFFFAQFAVALVWVNVAEKHGRRIVLFASLVGNGIAVILFGASKNLGSAITTRLALGLFNGAVGVARSAVADVTDDSNRPLAYTLVGLLWGLGGIVGSVLGGVLESPTKKYAFFADSALFAEYPYLLPCIVAGSVTIIGGLLALFLDRDGGERKGGIHLPTEKDIQVAAGALSRVRRWTSEQLSKLWRYVTGRQAIELGPRQAGPVSLHASTATATDRTPLASPALSPSILDGVSERNPFGPDRRPSRQYGSAYGYSRRPSASASTLAGGYGGAYYGGGGGGVGGPGESGLRIPSIRRRTARSVSVATSNRYDPDNDVPHSFAERLLLANNQAVFNLSDVFLAKAAADDLVSQRDYESSIFERDDVDEDDEFDEAAERGEDEGGNDANSEYGDVGFGTAPPSMDDLRGEAARQESATDRVRDVAAERTGSPAPSLNPPGRRAPAIRSPHRETMPSFGQHLALNRASASRLRRASVASSIRPVSIFSNSGLDPDTLASASVPATTSSSALGGPSRPDESGFSPMAAIPEARAPSIIERGEGDDYSLYEAEKAPSPLSQLPKFLILQYSVLALHGTTNDQLFTSFLVAPLASGGLGLEASHYAALIALMFFFSVIWQFRFYPSVGPPNGPLTHLAMFRLGLFLYVPVYFLVPELRGLIKAEGENGLVFAGMVVLTAIRYLANALAYTAIMILINVVTPPEYVPLANGLAQSAVSFARFLGPLVGGYVFAASISDKSNPQPQLGFYLIAVLCFIGFLASWRIR